MSASSEIGELTTGDIEAAEGNYEFYLEMLCTMCIITYWLMISPDLQVRGLRLLAATPGAYSRTDRSSPQGNGPAAARCNLADMAVVSGEVRK